ncbi:MAG: hypothetical protein ACYTHK_12890 [Planctomycetota bacterium]|jgi:hypothetical protein
MFSCIGVYIAWSAISYAGRDKGEAKFKERRTWLRGDHHPGDTER